MRHHRQTGIRHVSNMCTTSLYSESAVGGPHFETDPKGTTIHARIGCQVPNSAMEHHLEALARRSARRQVFEEYCRDQRWKRAAVYFLIQQVFMFVTGTKSAGPSTGRSDSERKHPYVRVRLHGLRRTSTSKSIITALLFSLLSLPLPA